jgi:hypothetical protein
MPQAYFPLVRREPYLVSYWRLNDLAGAIYATDYGSRYDLQGVYATAQSPGPALIQNDSGTASSVFGGTDASMSIADVTTLRILGDISLEAWVAPYAGNQNAIIIGKMNTGISVPNPYALFLDYGMLKASFGNGSTQTTVSYSTPIPVSIPSHVVATSFRGAITLYLNGNQVASGLLGAQSVTDGSHSLYVGHGFAGLIGEVAIYNGALSARRIARHFQIGQQILQDPAHYTLVDPPVMT